MVVDADVAAQRRAGHACGCRGEQVAGVDVQASDSATQVARPSSATAGHETTLTAHVSGGTVEQNHGDVTFYADGDKIGTGGTDDSGNASVTWTPSNPGEITVTAKYAGNLNTTGSESSGTTVTVAEQSIATTTTVDAPHSAQVGHGSTVSADVTSSDGTVDGGTVTFTDGHGWSNDVDVAGGHAETQWNPTTADATTITATFNGAPGFAGSADSRTVQVSPAAEEAASSTTSLDGHDAATLGETTTLKARVDSGDTPVAGGSVTFTDGNEVIGTATVQSGGLATVDWTAENLGERTITATYNGSDNVLSSTDTTTVNVSNAPTTDPGNGNNTGGDSADSGSLGSAGSLDSLFGSLSS